jgi:hypothetical protein
MMNKLIYTKLFKKIIRCPNAENRNKVKDEHLIIEDEFAEFIKKFKLLKREIFATTEHVIEDEKGRHLLTI